MIDLPSLLKRANISKASRALRPDEDRRLNLPRPCVPDLGPAVAAGEHPAPVRTERYGVDVVALLLVICDLSSGLGVPRACRAVARTAHDHRAVGAEAGVVNLILVPTQERDLLAGRGVPYADDAGALGGDDFAAVGADVGDVDDAGEPGDGAQDLLGGQVPDLDIVILGVAAFEWPRTCTIGAEIRGIRDTPSGPAVSIIAAATAMARRAIGRATGGRGMSIPGR